MIRKRRASGLTLTEILVVVGIILVLAAIALPVYKSARGKARESSCSQNLRQLYMAMQIYSDLHDGGTTSLPGIPLTLPRNGFALKKHLDLPNGLFQCQDRHPEFPVGAYVFLFSATPSEQFPTAAFQQFASQLQERTPLIVDMNHRNDDKAGMQTMNKHFSFAMLANGSLIKANRRGSPGSFSYWTQHFLENP